MYTNFHKNVPISSKDIAVMVDMETHGHDIIKISPLLSGLSCLIYRNNCSYKLNKPWDLLSTSCINNITTFPFNVEKCSFMDQLNNP